MVELKPKKFKVHSLTGRKYIPKGNTGKLRPLGIPTADTRIAQEVIRRLIEPIYEKQFHENSFGFRRGRGHHQAVGSVLKNTQEGYRYTVDVIKGFFDNIPHDLIMTLRAEIADGNILDIIETFLVSGEQAENALTFTKIRKKSREKFEDTIRDITTRSHNLDAEVFVKK